MQNYKYEIRHETEYLLRMRNYIMTNYRSAGESGPFLLKIPTSDLLEMLTQKCFLIITRLSLSTWNLDELSTHTRHPEQKGTCNLYLIGAIIDLLLHLTEYFYSHVYCISNIASMSMIKGRRGFPCFCHLNRSSVSFLCVPFTFSLTCTTYKPETTMLSLVLGFCNIILQAG